jgi:hypothetical protein
MPTSVGHTHFGELVPTHATHVSARGVGRGVGSSWRRWHRLLRVQPRGTAVADGGVRPVVVHGARDREEPVVHPQPRLIARVVALFAYVGLLLAIFGCVVVLTGMVDRPLAPVPVLGAGAETLSEASTRARSSGGTHPAGTWTAPSRGSRPVGIRDHRRVPDQFSVRHAVTDTPMGLDPSFDLQADLMDMATSIRWHRSAASDLPPGSD